MTKSASTHTRFNKNSRLFLRHTALVSALVIFANLQLAYGAELRGKPTPSTPLQNVPGATQAANIPRLTKIASVSGSSARAGDPIGQQIQFGVPGNQANKPNVGQNVWLYKDNMGRNMAAFVQWPSQAGKENNVSVGHMRTRVTLSNTGRIDGSTRIWTGNNAQGFTGGVKVKLQDRNGNYLQWDMPVQKWGVNANNPVSQAGSPSDRTEEWHFPVPMEIVNQTARIRIIHQHTPEGRWDQTIEMAKELGEVLKLYADVYTTVAGGAGTPGGTQTGPTEPAVR